MFFLFPISLVANENTKKLQLKKRPLLILPVVSIDVNQIVKEQAAKIMITEGMKQKNYKLKLVSNELDNKQKIKADAVYLKIEKIKSYHKIHAVLMNLNEERNIHDIQLESRDEQQLIYKIRLAIAALFDRKLFKKLSPPKKKAKIKKNLKKFKNYLKNVKKNIALAFKNNKTINNKSLSNKKHLIIKKQKEKEINKKQNKVVQDKNDNPNSSKNNISSNQNEKDKSSIESYLIFKTLNLVSLGYIKDYITSEAGIFETDNNFNKYIFKFDGSLFYDNITLTALKYGFNVTKFSSLEKYDMPMNYNFNLGIELFPKSLPFSIFIRLNYEYYTFITLPEFGKGLQVAYNSFLWSALGIFKEFPLRGAKFWKLKFFTNNRIEVEYAQTLYSSTLFKKSGKYSGTMKGRFIKIFMLTSLSKTLYAGLFYSKYGLTGDLGTFSIDSTITGLQFGKSF